MTFIFDLLFSFKFHLLINLLPNYPYLFMYLFFISLSFLFIYLYIYCSNLLTYSTFFQKKRRFASL